MEGLKSFEKIGRMDRRLKIYSQQGDRNDYGEEVTTLKLEAEVWAKKDFRQTGSKEELVSDRITELRKVIWIIRYPVELEINAKMVVEDEDKKEYDIETISEIGRKRFLILQTTLRE